MRDLWGFDASDRDAAEARGRETEGVGRGRRGIGRNGRGGPLRVREPRGADSGRSRRARRGFVVIGKTGHGGLRRTLMGSISDYVVRHATAPVVVVGE